jgi:hypothetical protein
MQDGPDSSNLIQGRGSRTSNSPNDYITCEVSRPISCSVVARNVGGGTFPSFRIFMWLQYTGCGDDAAVVFYTFKIEGSSVAWRHPVKAQWMVGPYGRSIDATRQLWAFSFAKIVRPSPRSALRCPVPGEHIRHREGDQQSQPEQPGNTHNPRQPHRVL